MKIVKKILKFLLWAITGILGLLLLVALSINIPSVQNYLLHKVTKYVSAKTHSTVTVGRIGISFPKSLYLEDVFLDDLQQDTLLFAGEIKVDLNMLALLKNNVQINKLELHAIRAKINRSEADSMFNFNFILHAFSDSAKKENLPPSEKKESDFSVSKINLEGIQIAYDDLYGGMQASVRFDKLNLSTDKIDFKTLRFNLDEIEFDKAALAIIITKRSIEKVSDATTVFPFFAINKVQFTQIAFRYESKVDSQEFEVALADLDLKNGKLNLQSNSVIADRINLKNCITNVALVNKSDRDSIVQSSVADKPWNIAVGNIHLENNSFSYNIINTLPLTKSFDPNHINLAHVNVNLKKISYDDDQISADIQNISLIEKNGLTIKQFKTDFLFTQQNIRLKDFYFETEHSKISQDLNCSYSSLNAFKDSLGSVLVALNIQKSKIHPRDVLYFAPALESEPIFNSNRPLMIEGNISGTINNIESKHLLVAFGDHSIVKTAFQIKGLPDAQTADFNFSQIDLATGRSDIISMLPEKMIPGNLQIPVSVSLTGNFAGTLKTFNTELNLETETGELYAKINLRDSTEYTGTIAINNFDLGKLLKDEKTFGPVTLTADIAGNGFSKENINASVKLAASSFRLNQYTYHNLVMNGKISDQQYEGIVTLNDSNAVFSFDGVVGYKKGEEKYVFVFDLKAADLKKLHLMEEDIRIAARAQADLKGNTLNTINGNAGITQITIVKNGEKYLLDSLLFASINENGKSEFNMTSAIAGIKYNGTFAPGDLVKEIKNHINRYFPVAEKATAKKEHHFNFEIQFHNHPILTEVFFPKLKEFAPGIITGQFDSGTDELKIEAGIIKLNYNGTEINNAKILVQSNAEQLNFSLASDKISSGKINIVNFNLTGDAKNNIATLLLTTGEDQHNKYSIGAQIKTKEDHHYGLHLLPAPVLNSSVWSVPEINEIVFGKDYLTITGFSLAQSNQLLSVEKKSTEADMEIVFKNFELSSFSKIAEKDTAIAEGQLNGNISLKNDGGFNSDLLLNNLRVQNLPVGNLHLNGKTIGPSRYGLTAKLTGNDNNMQIEGTIEPKSENTLNLNIRIENLNVETAEAFSFGQLKNSSGKIKGNLNASGSFAKPLVEGNISFLDASTTPAYLNHQVTLKNETINIAPGEIKFSSFTIRDKNNNTAVFNGTVSSNDFSKYFFDLKISTADFLLLNTTSKDNKIYYGTLIIDSDIDIKGNSDFPRISSELKLKEGTYFTFAVPETKLSTDKGEGIVLFNDSAKLNPILTRNLETVTEISSFKGFDLDAQIEVNKNATMKLLIDPASGDSLVVKGDASLSFSLDPSGKISLSGRYELFEGSYLVSLQDYIKKNFEIEKGGTIIWNGDPLDAEININAVYHVRTSPINLVADQISGLSEAEKNSYKQRLPFMVILKIRGALLKPDISFEIQLPPEQRGALGGAVNAKLNSLNEDPGELNKQVFALLVLNRFVQQDPLASAGGSGGTEGLARTSVSKILTQQLNKLSSQYIKGVELDFDVQSYEDYSGSQNEGRTEVEVGLKKQLLNDRFSVKVGGMVDVEGEKAGQNKASDITGDVEVEYKLTEDGRYRLKGYRHNQYEGIIDGQLIETGAGIIYTRDFDKWKEFFTSPKKEEKKEKKSDVEGTH